MDLLGNFTSTAGGIKVNSGSSSLSMAVNATNEITSTDNANPAGAPAIISHLVFSEIFSGTGTTFAHELSGNLVDGWALGTHGHANCRVAMPPAGWVQSFVNGVSYRLVARIN